MQHYKEPRSPSKMNGAKFDWTLFASQALQTLGRIEGRLATIDRKLTPSQSRPAIWPLTAVETVCVLLLLASGLLGISIPAEIKQVLMSRISGGG